MFGLWRTILALEVAAYHLAKVPLIGQYAVFSFFALSGFLMTAVMARSYGYSLSGRLRFVANRALRLYPGYWASIAITLVLIALLGSRFMMTYNDALQVPATARAWFENLSMLFLGISPIDRIPRLSPPTWALTVEWCYYLLIALGLSRTRTRTLLWFGVSAAYHLAFFLHNPYSHYLYYAIPGGSLAFSAGALTYHYREWLTRALPRSVATIPMLVMALAACPLATLWLNAHIPFHFNMVGNWFNLLFSCFLIIELNRFNPAAATPAARLDRWIGEFSYPLYLLHWQAGAIACWLVLGQPYKALSAQGLGLFCVTVAIALLLACIQIGGIDPAIKRVRDRIRARGATRPDARTASELAAL